MMAPATTTKHCQSCGEALRRGPTQLDAARYDAGVCGAELCHQAVMRPALAAMPRMLSQHELMAAQGFSGPTLRELNESYSLARYGGDVIKKMRADNVRMWLALQCIEHGTDDQRKRFVQGTITEEEILVIARAILFKGFGAFPRWAKSHALDQMTGELRHAVHCTRRVVAENMSGPAEDLSAVEAKNLAALEGVADAARVHPWLVHTGGTVTVAVATHWLYCTCEAESSRSSAKVTILFGERELVREYAL